MTYEISKLTRVCDVLTQGQALQSLGLPRTHNTILYRMDLMSIKLGRTRLYRRSDIEKKGGDTSWLCNVDTMPIANCVSATEASGIAGISLEWLYHNSTKRNPDAPYVWRTFCGEGSFFVRSSLLNG